LSFKLVTKFIKLRQLATTTIDDETPTLHKIFWSSITTTPHMIQSFRH